MNVHEFDCGWCATKGRYAFQVIIIICTVKDKDKNSQNYFIYYYI